MSSNVFASNVWYSGNVTVAGTTSLSGTRTVQAFPPAAMTGYLTTLSSAGYGVGNYVASASSERGFGVNSAWYAFDKSGTTIWTSNLGYNTSTGVYTAANVTVDVTGSSYLGEWLQIQQPVSTVLSSYSISNRTDVNYESPNTFYVLGSRDGTNWTLVNSQTGITWSTNQVQTFTSASPQAFNYFRLVINIINVSGGTPTRVSIGDWVLNGSIQGAAFTADGRLGLGVVNPTRALEVAGDVVCGGTLSAGNPLMFRNALYNGGMVINQRGISTNWASPTAIGATASLYTLDRWNVYRGGSQTGAAVAQGTLAITDQPYKDGLQYYLRVGRVSGDTGTNFVSCDYNLESRDSYRFAGQTVTASFYYRHGSGFSGGSSLGVYVLAGTGTDQTLRAGLTNSSTPGGIAVAQSNAWQRASFTCFVPVNATQVCLNIGYGPTGTAGGFDYFDVTGVQLEKGLVATPFEVRPYATELALCQRYYYQFSSAAAVYTRFGAGFASTTSAAYTYMQFPVTMRAQPTLVSNSAATTFAITSSSAPFPGWAVTSFTVPDISVFSASPSWVSSAAFTAGASVIAIANNTTSAFLGFSAEL